jgi:hypothetical protein
MRGKTFATVLSLASPFRLSAHPANAMIERLQYETATTAFWLVGVPLPESFSGKPVTSAFE